MTVVLSEIIDNSQVWLLNCLDLAVSALAYKNILAGPRIQPQPHNVGTRKRLGSDAMSLYQTVGITVLFDVILNFEERICWAGDTLPE